MAWCRTRPIARRTACRPGRGERPSPWRPRLGNAGRDDVFDLWRARFDRCDGRFRADTRRPRRGSQIRARKPRGDDSKARREIRLAESGSPSGSSVGVLRRSVGCWSFLIRRRSGAGCWPWTRCCVSPSQIAAPPCGRGYASLLATSLGSCFSQISSQAIVAWTYVASSVSEAAATAISGPDIAPRDDRCPFEAAAPGNRSSPNLRSQAAIFGDSTRTLRVSTALGPFPIA